MAAEAPGSALASLRTAGERERSRVATLEHIYGSAAVMGRDLELQMLAEFGRLPGCGLPSSHVGLRSYTGDLDGCAWPEFSTARACASIPRGSGLFREEESQPLPLSVLHASIEEGLGLAPKVMAMEHGDVVPRSS